jgi:GT2 family glycosyltransferase
VALLRPSKLAVWQCRPPGFAYRSQGTRPAGSPGSSRPRGVKPSTSNRIALSPNESYPQHVVTAVIVAHDGAAWLPHVADAILGQTRPVQRVVAVDTGSRDRSGSVLGAKFGRSAAFGMDRSTGYGAAVARALQHRTANTAVPSPPGAPPGDRIEWLWLLHDDCEPAPDCLEQLLRGTVETTSAAVLGPKLRDWSNRDVILEAGVTLDTATRRVTGIEPREVDQGQHDGDRDVLAVSSAGMLVRRDVWEQVGGFDTGMGLFMEDIDFCWRVHAAGYRVRVITDAIAYHVQAAARHRRVVSVGRRARMLDRRNGLLALLGNLPMRPMLKAAAGNVLVSLLRITFFLLAKRLAAAVDEFSALISVLCHPVRLISMRGRRARGRRAAYSRVRADLPSGRSARRLAEFVMSTLSKSQPDTAGAHHASADPAEDDSMLVDNGLGKRLLTSPSLLTFAALLAVALTAGRSLIGSGPLGGGSLVPAWGGASDLWGSYIQSFHPAGIGASTPAAPWLAVLAALATLLAGKTWLAIDVLMIGCVPLAGMTAMVAVRKVTASPAVRVWASVSYALLPVATGIVASGRFGSAAAFILLPLILAQGGRMVTASGATATRAAWATGLLVAVGAAFVPLLWIVTLVACVLTAIVFRVSRPGLLRNLAIAVLTPPFLLLPWSLTLLSHGAGLLLEAGLPQQGTPAFTLPARSLVLLSPGGPGLPPYWITAGLFAAAFGALFAGRRRQPIVVGWAVALAGVLTAAIVSHTVVRLPAGGQVAAWAGLPLALAALGLLLAAAAGADALGRLLAGVKGLSAVLSGRGPWVALVALVACSTPLLAAVAWLSAGVSGPVHPVSKPVVPELVAVAAGQGRQVRTLVLRSTDGHVSYLLLRGPSPSLADTTLTPPPDAQRALGQVVAALITPTGGQAADQARLLADLDVGYVLVQAPVDKQLARVLNNVSGLQPYSTTSGYSLWRLDARPARVTVIEPDGTVVAIRSGVIGVSGASVPAAGGTLMLAEPAGGWTASVNGHRLAQVPSPAGSWAQAFRLNSGGGKLSVGYSGFTRDLLLVVELLAFLVVVGLALPGMHVAGQEAPSARSAAAADSDVSAAGTGRRSAVGLAGDSGESGLAAGAHSGRRAALAGAASAAGALQARSRRLARGARSRAGRGQAAASEKVGRAGTEGQAGSEVLAGRAGRAGRASPSGISNAARRGVSPGARPRETRAQPGRLADAWPYAGQDDVSADARLGDDGPGDTRLADAWPYAADQPRQARDGDLLPEPRPSRASDPADAGSRQSRPGGRGRRGRSHSDEPDHDRRARRDLAATQLPGRPYDDGYLEPGPGRPDAAAGWSASGRSAAGRDLPYDLDASSPGDRGAVARSPSGRSPSGAWPYFDEGDEVPGGSAAGPDWPDLDRPAWSEGQSTRAYRLPDEQRSLPARLPDQHRSLPGGLPYDELDPSSDTTRPAPPDWRPAPDRGNREPGEQRRGRRGTRRPARHGGGRAASDYPPGEPASAWPGGAEALEPLPPIDGPGRRQSARSARRSTEHTGEHGSGDDDAWTDQRWSAPLPEHDADYEPEYGGDSW